MAYRTLWKSYHTEHLTEKYLYRFHTLKYMEAFLQTSRMWFSRVDMFKDKMECVHVPELLEKKLDIEKIEKRSRRFLVSCWHAANRESLALWDSYASCDEERKKVAIRFLRKDLVYYVCDNDIRNSHHFRGYPRYLHGGVVYRNLLTEDMKELSRSTVREPAFRKEYAFKYENEYRFVIEQKTAVEEKGYGYQLDDMHRLRFRIIVNPLLDNPEYIRVHERMQEIGFGKFLEFSPLVRWLKPQIWAKAGEEEAENETQK